MQLRVVTDQPWDVKADVLAIPIVGEPAFDGPLGELDRRTGGELEALAAFGELRASASRRRSRRPGELPAGRVLTVGAGDADEARSRDGRSRSAPPREHRLGGRAGEVARDLDTPLADVLDGGVDAVAELVARGVVEGGFDPKTLYRDDVATAPPVLDELILVAPGADAGAARRPRSAAMIIGEGANHARVALEPVGQRRHARRSSPTRPAPSPRSTACGSTSSSPTAPASSGWGCSSRSARAATTRPG